MTRLLVVLMTAVGLSAQAPLTMSEAVDSAVRNYPSVRVSQEQINAAAAGIQLARTAYLPKVDAMAQVNRATRNNVFGMLLPQSVIPSISGPVLGTNNFGTAWGSAMGVLVTWEPFDFGLRKASVDASAAARAASEASLKKTEFEVSVAAADAYVTLVAAQETVRAAQAGVDRAEAISRTIHAQVNAQLRPGADASRVDAEVAAARTLMIQAQQAVDVARVNVSQFVGLPPAQIAVASAKLLQLPPEGAVAPLDTAANPVAVEQNAVVEQLKAQLKILERSYFPRFFAQASTYARGTGAEVNGNNLGGVNGLAPTIQNSRAGLYGDVFGVGPAVDSRQGSRAIGDDPGGDGSIPADRDGSDGRSGIARLRRWEAPGTWPPTRRFKSLPRARRPNRRRPGINRVWAISTRSPKRSGCSRSRRSTMRWPGWVCGAGCWDVATAAGDIRPFVAEASQ